jgi:hypothetical protein
MTRPKFGDKELEKFVPHYTELSELKASVNQSTGKMGKTGFWLVGCYTDKDPDRNRQYYKSDDPLGAMTPQVCFKFCKTRYGMQFFFLKRGKECSCARYYHKGPMKDKMACSLPCEGDQSKMCGGDTAETVYEMHDCKAAAYKPHNAHEHLLYRAELYEKKAEFYIGGEVVLPQEKLETGQPGGGSGDHLGHSLNLCVTDSKTGVVDEVIHFNLDGYNPTTQDYEAAVAVEEGLRFREVTANLRYNTALMVAFKPTRSFRYVSWSADVEEGLKSMGCPLVEKPEDGYGYVCIGAAHKYTPQSEAFPEGHVSAYGSMLAIENYLYYEMDCEVSEWYDEGECSLTCGTGEQLQKRHVTQEPANGGEPCPEDFERTLPCNEDFCPIDCEYEEWSGFGECDAPCGPGENHRYRSVTVFTEHGGVECEEPLENTKPCQVVPCPIDCEYAEWKEWSDCSEFCGPGTKKHYRGHAVEAKYGGKPCEGPKSEEADCFVKPCPVDCEVSDWANDGDCSATCGGGQQKQTRRILVAAQHGGGECPSDLEQFLPCNAWACPVDCEMADWEEDGFCSHTCGGGEVMVRRYIMRQPAFGGAACPTTLEKFQECAEDPCPIDCIIAPWTGWGDCSATCGEGTNLRTRYEEIPAQHGGRICPSKLRQERFCEIMPCAINGQWGEWGEWGKCSAQCGPGKQHRERKIAIHAQFGGVPCEGPDQEEQNCEIKPCPVECKLSDWKDEGGCDKVCGTGKQHQVRIILVEAQHGAASCPGEDGLNQDVDCNTHSCPVDCEMSNWEDDGTCSLSCGGGLMKQVRSISVQPQFGGKPCPVRLNRDIPCATDYCPIDCVWNSWTGWSACSEFCGPGEQTRVRQRLVVDEYGGAPCDGEETDARECNVRPCPIDGKWTQWTEWGDCDQECGPGKSKRSRTIEIQPQFGGKPLEGPMEGDKDCDLGPCPVDCEISDWQKSGICSLTCGGGSQKYTRTILQEAQHGGANCPDTLSRVEPCNEEGCPVDCVLTDWVEDGDCSKTCGGGKKMEVKTITTAPSNGGKVCGADLQRQVDCHTQQCPIDCEWGPWSGWNMCDEFCGPGKQKARRHHAVVAEHGGATCDGPETRERPCELVPCAIDCVWSDWTDWAMCDESCGDGFQERSRYHETHAQYGGKPCEGPFMEEQACKIKECPVECEISKWLTTGDCTKVCGGGTQREERQILQAAQHGGEACPSDLTRDVPCNEDPCAVDCVVTGWVNDGTCTQSCGGGVMHQVKNILVQPDHGGQPCPSTMEQFILCKSEACPVDCMWGPWSGWSPCNAACGDGQQTRSRSISINADFGGMECEGAFDEEQGCKLVDCPVDAVWAEWQEWAPCDEPCGPGWQTRQRSLDVEAQFGGKPAEGPSYEIRECQVKPCPIDCVVSQWFHDGECDASCGGGDQKEKRTIKVEVAHGGAECPADLNRTVVCNENPCPVDCELSGWSKNGECSVSCDGGILTEVRSIVVPAADGGRGCDAPISRTKECGKMPCPVDCVWANWSPFGYCSVTCGSGERKRKRDVVTGADHGGAECEGESEESEECGDPCPVDCEWDEWEEWGPCDQECGDGEKRRIRQKATQAAFGGKPCEGPEEEVDTCKEKECAVPCDITEWVKTTDCTVTCGGGLHEEERTINQQALFGGEECPTDLVRNVPCNLWPCPVDCVMSAWEPMNGCSTTCGGGEYTEEIVVLTQMANAGVECPPEESWRKQVDCNTFPCPIDCQWGMWSGFGHCSHTCGGGIQSRQRSIDIEADHGGADCVGPADEEQPCNAFFCPIDCVWGDWQDWTTCSEECGPGMSTREREVSVSAAYGGKACEGVPREEKDCQIKFCPVDCVMSDFFDAGVCSTSCGQGERVQKRTIEVKDDHGGVVCPTSLERKVACSAQPCPIDCVLSSWFDDGECSLTCGGGKQNQLKSIDVAPEHGGHACDPLQQQFVDCNMQACPIDCEVSDWSEWGDCSVSCNDGKKERTREVTVHPQYGGAACPTEYKQDAHCKPIDCPIDCVLHEWSDWSACSMDCGPGTQTRTRGVKVKSKFGGHQCEGAHEDQMSCFLMPCPVDCEVTPWEDAGDCSLTCGGGQRKQKREVSQEALHGGEECPGLTQFVECNTQDCPIDCKMSDWTAHTECTLSCGGGEQDWKREVVIAPAFGGVTCPRDWDKTEPCNEDPCPIDCVWGQWSAWGACSVTCGGGQKVATRAIAIERDHGGVACTGETTKSDGCNPLPCPIDCTVSPWAAWTECSTTCGAGTQTHSRTVTIQPQHGGETCPTLSGSRDCNPGPCPIHCEITEAWEVAGDCSKTCGGGMMPKSRNILVQPQHGGRLCPQTAKDFPCNQHECPIDCEVSDWVDDGTCTSQCGGGQQDQKRFITVSAAFGGIACPTDMEQTIDCNTELCPTQPVGESGVATFDISAQLLQAQVGGKMELSSGWVTYYLNGQYETPVIFAGVPSASAIVQLSGVRRIGVQEEVPKCPVDLEAPMKQGNLKAMTSKKSTAPMDSCVGLEGDNPCHDDDSDGGDVLGFLLEEPIVGRESDFVKLERAVSGLPEPISTCVGIRRKNPCPGIEGVKETENRDTMGYIFKLDVPEKKRPHSVMLTRKKVSNLCGNFRQFFYQTGKITATEKPTDEELRTWAEAECESKFGLTAKEMEEMSNKELLAQMLEDLELWGITCEVTDTCTGIQGQNFCRLPQGEKAAEEEELGWIIAADPDTDDPAGNWQSCAREVMCPIPYDTPKPAQLVTVTKKEFEGVACVGTDTNNLCGGDSPTGGEVLGVLFVEPLSGLPMKEVTAEELGEQREKKGSFNPKARILGYAFTEKKHATVKVGDVFLGRETFMESWGQCGKFDDAMLKWGFQLKVDYGEEGPGKDEVQTAFLTYDSGIYEAVSAKDHLVKHRFQVGKVKVKGADEWTKVDFHEAFDKAPLVLTQVQTYNTGKPVKTRLEQSPEADSFSVGLETTEGMKNANDEFIGWMAFEEVTDGGKIGGLSYVAKLVDGVTDEKTEIELDPDLFTAKPQVFTTIETYHGDKPAHLVETTVTDKAIEIMVENDAFDESSHAGEKVAVFIFQGKSHQAAPFNGWLLKKVVYGFEAGEWSACSTVCGEGTSTREVKCSSSVGHTTVDDQYCDGEKPAHEKACGSPCSWQISDWSVCPGRGENKEQERTAQCVLGENGSGEGVADEECPTAKPELTKKCCNPKTAADFPDLQCGTKENGCSDEFAGNAELGSCGSDWACKDNMCACEAGPVTVKDPHLTSDYVNAFGGAFSFICPDGEVLTGAESVHSDPFEDRKWKFTCARLAEPARLGACQFVKQCGGKEDVQVQCPPVSALVGVTAPAPIGEDRSFKWKCCKITAGGSVELEEEGASEFSEPQAALSFVAPAAEWGHSSKVLTGVESKWFQEKVDRTYKWSYASFTTKTHCETCTVDSITVANTETFAAGWAHKFSADLDFECPSNEVLEGVKSEYVAERLDAKWQLKCAPVNGTELSDCEDAKPPACSVAGDSEYTKTKSDFSLECPALFAMVGVSSKYNVEAEDREYKFKCCKLASASGYVEKSQASAQVGEEATWSFSAGAAAIDSVSSYYRPGEGRRFTFYSSTYEGAKTCTSEWKPTR